MRAKWRPHSIDQTHSCEKEIQMQLFTPECMAISITHFNGKGEKET